MSNPPFKRRTLESLPVELLYEIQLFALSEHLPHTCHYLYQVYKLAPNHYHAQYILGRFYAVRNGNYTSIVTRSLRYPICSQQIFEAILHHPECPPTIEVADLPKRLFRYLTPKAQGKLPPWDENDDPLPFLRYLYRHSRFLPPDPNAHDGYALTKAVSAKFVPLVRFLLKEGASPRHKDNLAVMIAIQRMDLSMVRLLLEKGYGDGGAKKAKLGDRIIPTVKMLRKAVKCGARDIVTYLVDEKSVVPDMQTLKLLIGSGYSVIDR